MDTLSSTTIQIRYCRAGANGPNTPRIWAILRLLALEKLQPGDDDAVAVGGRLPQLGRLLIGIGVVPLAGRFDRFEFQDDGLRAVPLALEHLGLRVERQQRRTGHGL